METKLTLRLNKEIIERMKIYALKHQKSLSAMTEELYKSLLLRSDDNSESKINSPIAKKYKGIISNTDFDALLYNLKRIEQKNC